MMAESQCAIEARGLTKRFGRKLVVDDLNMKVPKGSVFAFLGRNGAGKTTTIRMLMNLLDRSAGEVCVLGLDPRKRDFEIKRRIGYVAEGQRMYGWMTVSQIMWFCSGFYPNWDDGYAKQLMHGFELPAEEKIRNLSRGTQAKLALLLAMAHRPELLILDEPTGGLDVVVRREFLMGVIQQILQEGSTVFFSSHLVHEVERVADWVGVIEQGRLIAAGPMDELKNTLTLLVVSFPEAVPADMRIAGALSTQVAGRQARIVVRGCSEDAMTALQPYAPQSVEAHALSLEDIFVTLVGEEV
jgi:ABC-2 type transport system ATP-binding protein